MLLTNISALMLSKSDQALLQALNDPLYNRFDLETEMRDPANSTWIVTGPGARFFLIMSPRDYGVLEILGVAGKGWMSNFVRLLPALKRIAEELGCRAIGGFTRRKGLYRFYERVGGKVDYQHYIMELN